MPKTAINAALVLFLGVSGCGQGKYPLVELSGTVTFDQGECPAPGNVTLRPLGAEEGLPTRPASGQFMQDGKYTINAFSDSRGVLPGRYQIEVTCFAGAPDLSKPDPWGAVNYIAAEYEPTEITIDDSSSSMTFDIDVPRRAGVGE